MSILEHMITLFLPKKLVKKGEFTKFLEQLYYVPIMNRIYFEIMIYPITIFVLGRVEYLIHPTNEFDVVS